MGQKELFDQKLFNHLTVCKQMTDHKLNWCYIAILQIIYLCVKIELLVLHSKTWNYLTVCK